MKNIKWIIVCLPFVVSAESIESKIERLSYEAEKLYKSYENLIPVIALDLDQEQQSLLISEIANFDKEVHKIVKEKRSFKSLNSFKFTIGKFNEFELIRLKYLIVRYEMISYELVKLIEEYEKTLK
ncbi:MAG TPA: hypothetical protein VHA52_02195 [Candidatus Babeliaceae bacterium]|nr:hypothetical protein [Candidatus Babeliaceae bacterium]